MDRDSARRRVRYEGAAFKIDDEVKIAEIAPCVGFWPQFAPELGLSINWLRFPKKRMYYPRLAVFCSPLGNL